MAQEASDKVQRSEELKRQIEALTTDLVEAIDTLTRDLQRSLLMLADRVEQRMEAIGFGRLSGPVVNDIQEGVTAEAKRFSEQARSKIQEITRAKAGLSGAADELSALAAMTESEREALRKRLQDEISSSEKTRQELEAELADARVKIADLEKQMRSQSTRDARRIDKLQATNKQLSDSLKQTEAELLKLREQSQKAISERDLAVKQVDELNAKLAATTAAVETAAAADAASRKNLEAKVKSLSEQLKQAQEAEVAAKDELEKAAVTIAEMKVSLQQLESEQSTAQEQLKEYETKVENAEKQITSFDEKLQVSEQEVITLRQTVQELEKVKAKAEIDTEVLDGMKQELAEAKKEAAKTVKQLGTLEAQIEELTSLNESYEDKIADLEEEQKKLKGLTKDRDDISKEKDELEKRLEKALAEIEKMKEDYAKFAEIRDRLQMLEARSHVQDILLKKDQHYIVLTTFATKIVEGKIRCDAKELGFSPTLGVSLAAWLDKFFLDLQEEELVSIHRTAGRGLPSAEIEVTEKGRQLFEEAKQQAAL